jgi:hypothetical protein
MGLGAGSFRFFKQEKVLREGGEGGKGKWREKEILYHLNI